MLNSVKWEYFKLEDLFEISSGRRLKKMDHIEGDIPYVSSTQYNNGVDGKIGNGYTHKNGISIGAYGGVGEAFYHPYKFWASDSVNIISPKDRHFNEYTGLFIVSIIKKEQYRYSYGRGLSCKRLTTTSIKLPIDSNGEPNWKFMEDYMKKISKGNLEGFNLPKNNTRLRLDEREWDEFKLEDLFEIERGKRLIKKNRIPGNIPYMSASEINNGITDKISNPLFVKRNSLCLTTFGDAFYHKTKFTASDEVTILTNKHLNSYVGLFMVSVLQHQKYRYSFGRKLYYNKIKYIDIKLPIKPKSSPEEKSEPDWEFMENYIKGLPYTSKL